MKLLTNGAVLGLLMLLVEGGINMLAGRTFVSAIVISFAAGTLYTYLAKKRMPLSTKMWALVTYFALVTVITALSFVAGAPLANDALTAAVIAVAVFYVFAALFMFLGMTVGSMMVSKSLAKKG